MSKKKILYAIIALMVLVLCYVIGQTVVKPSREDGEVSQTERETDSYYSFFHKGDELKLVGYAETTDMPGGKTVGLVEDDVYDAWILMTPHTSVEAGVVLDDASRTLSFTYVIHKNVSELSDGMSLLVEVVNADTSDVWYSQQLTVDSAEKVCDIDLSEYRNKNVTIRLSAVEHTEDETGDWLVIQNAIIN